MYSGYKISTLYMSKKVIPHVQSTPIFNPEYTGSMGTNLMKNAPKVI